MSDIFLEEPSVPAPNDMLGVGSASHAVQTAPMMRGRTHLVGNVMIDSLIAMEEPFQDMKSTAKLGDDILPALEQVRAVAEETRVFGVAAAQRSRIDRFIAVAQDLFFRTQFVARLIPNVYHGLAYIVPHQLIAEEVGAILRRYASPHGVLRPAFIEVS